MHYFNGIVLMPVKLSAFHQRQLDETFYQRTHLDLAIQGLRMADCLIPDARRVWLENIRRPARPEVVSVMIYDEVFKNQEWEASQERQPTIWSLLHGNSITQESQLVQSYTTRMRPRLANLGLLFVLNTYMFYGTSCLFSDRLMDTIPQAMTRNLWWRYECERCLLGLTPRETLKPNTDYSEDVTMFDLKLRCRDGLPADNPMRPLKVYKTAAKQICASNERRFINEEDEQRKHNPTTVEDAPISRTVSLS